jgi:hypothetical protein
MEKIKLNKGILRKVSGIIKKIFEKTNNLVELVFKLTN